MNLYAAPGEKSVTDLPPRTRVSRLVQNYSKKTKTKPKSKKFNLTLLFKTTTTKIKKDCVCFYGLGCDTNFSNSSIMQSNKTTDLVTAGVALRLLARANS